MKKELLLKALNELRKRMIVMILLFVILNLMRFWNFELFDLLAYQVMLAIFLLTAVFVFEFIRDVKNHLKNESEVN